MRFYLVTIFFCLIGFAAVTSADAQTQKSINEPAAVAAGSRDVSADYMEACTGWRYKSSASFCKCSLNAFSDETREKKKKKLSALEMGTKERGQTLLSDPAITQSKIDAICALSDEIRENDRLAKLASLVRDREKNNAHILKKGMLSQKRKELAASYGAIPLSESDLSYGNHCNAKHEVMQIKQDQAETSARFYGEARRILEGGGSNYHGHIFKSGHRAKCPK